MNTFLGNEWYRKFLNDSFIAHNFTFLIRQ